MSYDPNVLRRAVERLEGERRARSDRAERLRADAYTRQPRLARLDRELQATMSQLMVAALRQGESPAQAISHIKEHNLDLQKERVVLLGALGLPEDGLDDKPGCPLCGDTGWKGAKMCQCLQKLYAEEQIKELSKLLDLGEQSFDTFRLDYYSQTPWPGRGASPRENMELVYEVFIRRAGSGQDLSGRLYSPHGVGEGPVRGRRHRRQYFCPV